MGPEGRNAVKWTLLGLVGKLVRGARSPRGFIFQSLVDLSGEPFPTESGPNA